MGQDTVHLSSDARLPLLVAAQPMVFGVAVILSRYVTDATTVGSLGRPLLVVVAAAVISLLILHAATRNWWWSATFASAIILLSLREPLAGSIVFAISMWWPLVDLLRRIARRPAPSETTLATVSRASAIFAVVYLAVMAWNAWAATTSRPVASAPDFQTDGSGGPNVYLILLDGYPSADTLDDTFGIDNSAFAEALEHLGFDVSDQAQANYNKTWLTLASMFNGAYVHDLLADSEIPGESSSQTRWLQSLIAEGAAIDGFRARGYRVRTVPSAFVSTSLTTADEYADQGVVTEFEARLLRQSPWSLVLGDQLRSLLVESQRQNIGNALEMAALWAEARTDASQFVFAHVQSPHTPFVLGADAGGEQAGPACFPRECSFWSTTVQELGMRVDRYRDELAAQLDGLNPRILDALRRIVAADGEAVVILMSDHGTRYSLTDLPEHFQSFLAARTPGADGLFAEDESPVNVLRGVFRAYFGAGLEPSDYEAWLSPWGGRYLELTRYEVPASTGITR